jgi:RNA polymerase sigma-70 factor (ECF subfamily)
MDDAPTEASGRSLECYGDYLKILTRMQLGPSLQAKVDASDIVQHALMMAHHHRDQFRGQSEGEWLGWLRTILARTIAETARRFGTAAREVSRERSLEVQLEESSARLAGVLAADHTSPSERAARAEELLRLAGALARLPADERQAIELHHLQNVPLAEIAKKLGRTRAAVAGLLFRGLKRLREQLRASSAGDATGDAP